MNKHEYFELFKKLYIEEMDEDIYIGLSIEFEEENNQINIIYKIYEFMRGVMLQRVYLDELIKCYEVWIRGYKKTNFLTFFRSLPVEYLLKDGKIMGKLIIPIA